MVVVCIYPETVVLQRQCSDIYRFALQLSGQSVCVIPEIEGKIFHEILSESQSLGLQVALHRTGASDMHP